MGICDGSSGANLLIEYSDDPSLDWDDAGHTWNDVRDAVGTLTPSGGDKQAGSFQTFNGVETGLSKSGLKNIALNVVFRNAANSFLEFLTDTWDETSPPCFWLRWSYNGGAVGALRRTAKIALLTNPFTGGAAGDGNPVTKSLTFVIDGDVYRDAVPSP